MAYSLEEWEVVRAFWERGLTLSVIVARPEVTIKDRGSISRKAKQDGWEKTKKATLLAMEVKTKQDVAEIAEEKATLNTTELAIHNTLVDERTKYIAFFDGAAIKNVKEAMKAQCSDQVDYKYRAETIQKGREVVLGKAPDTAIQINNEIKFDPAKLRTLSTDEASTLQALMEKAGV